MKKRKTKTTVEVHQFYVIRELQTVEPVRCPECVTGGASMVSPEEASVVARIPPSSDLLHAAVSALTIHFVETPEGWLVCTNSLLNRISLGDGGLHSDGADTSSPPAADPSDAADQ